MNNDLNEALEQIDMEQWLDDQGIRYKRTRGASGQQLNLRECPCCGNAKWKVYLNADTGLGNCFSGDCEVKFSKWKFIQASLGSLTNREVVDHIKTFAKGQGWRPRRIRSVAVNTDTLTLPASIALPYEGRNLAYLTRRGITGEMAQYFNLRFCHKGGFRYHDDEGEARYQSYDNRVIIPIFDLLGDMVSFQGRDITGEAERKYLFPPGFASTGSHIYNGHNIGGCKHIVLNEGVFDVIATKVALDEDPGLRDIGVGGTFGKHLSHGDADSQLARLLELKRGGLEMITMMWDAEPKAIDDAINTALLLRGHGFKTRVAILPEGCDPNETTPDAVRDAFYKAQPIDKLTAVTMKLSWKMSHR